MSGQLRSGHEMYKHVLRSKQVIVGTCTWSMKYADCDNFSSPAKTVRHASLCLHLGIWIIVSPLPPRFLKHLPSISVSTLYKCSQAYTDVATLCACCR